MKFLSLRTKNYSFLEEKEPSGSPLCRHVLTDRGSASVPWAVTEDFGEEARNHCAATMVTNFIILKKKEVPDLPDRERDPFYIFSRAHAFIRNGPIFDVKKKAEKCFANLGLPYECRVIRPSSPEEAFEAAKENLDEGRLCGLLVAASLFQWHWIMAVGYEIWPDGKKFLLIEDNWHREGLRRLDPAGDTRIMNVTVFKRRLTDEAHAEIT